MASNTSFEDDFQGEFKPLRRLGKEEAEQDRLVKRMRFQRKLEELEKSEQENTSIDAANKEPSTADGSDSSTNGIFSRYAPRGVTYKSKGNKMLTPSEETNPFREGRTKSTPKASKTSKAFAKIQNLKLYNSVEGDNPYIEKGDSPSETHNGDSQAWNDANNISDTYMSDESSDILEMDRSMPSNPVLDSITDYQSVAEDGGIEVSDVYAKYVADEQDIQSVKRQVLQQLLNSSNSSDLIQTPRLKDKFKEVYSMFEHTVRDNEGHSTLIVGPRSSGKTLIIEEALKQLTDKYSNSFIVVKLNSLIHSDDRVALREIARQLDENAKRLSSDASNNSNDEDNGAKKTTGFEQRSIGDTFANILSTLDRNTSGVEENDSNEQTSIPMIFIIDEFEKFTSNNKQTLLYNLFDLSQSSQSPICIVGVSTRATARELLEKRVRSRFSQRIITINKASTVDELWASAKLGLQLSSSSIGKLLDAEYGRLWNQYIDHLFEPKSDGSVSHLKKIVYQNFFTIKNYKEMNNSWVHAIAKIDKSFPFPRDSHFKKYYIVQSKNHIQSIVSSLSTLELLLVIAAARWVEKSELPVINFNLAYKEYEDMIKMFNLTASVSTTSSSVDHRILSNIRVNQKIWSSNVLKNCWESLYKMGLLLDSAGITTNSDGHIISNVNLNKNYIIEDNKMVQLDITLEEIGNLIDETNVYKKLTKL